MNKNGFTLVELLAVILIVAIIAVIAIFSINGILARARVDNDVNLVRQVLNAGRSFHEELQADRTMQNRPDLDTIFRPMNATTANTLTNGFFNRCDLNPLTTANYHEGTDNFNRSLHRMTFNANHTIRAIDVETLINYGFLRRALLDQDNLSSYAIDFNSCEPTRVMVLISRSGLAQYNYTIALSNI